MIGEMWDLERLCEKAEELGRWTCFVSSVPMKVSLVLGCENWYGVLIDDRFRGAWQVLRTWLRSFRGLRHMFTLGVVNNSLRAHQKSPCFLFVGDEVSVLVVEVYKPCRRKAVASI